MLSILLKVVLVIVVLKIIRIWSMGRVKSNACLVGKTAIVTGGNLGLGYRTSLALASRGCKVIIACRSNAEKVKQDIIRYTNNPNIIVKHLDLSSNDSIRAFAKDINCTEDRLDILINNAGISSSTQSTGKPWDFVLQVNHYGPFLLTHLLADLLKKSAPSRVIFVSSTASFMWRPTVDQIHQKTNVYFTYGRSKLCNIISAKMFARKFKDYGVTVNALHPGIVKTDIFDKTEMDGINKFVINILYYMTRIFMKTPEEGAQTQIHLAVSGKLQNVTGKFFVNCRKFIMPLRARDDKFCEDIWRISEESTELKPEEKLR